MTNEQFENLVKRLETQAIAKPGQYKFKVLLLALIGNAYLVSILLVLLGLLGGSIASILVLKALAVKLIIVVGIFLWTILKALWVKIDPPTGLKITARDAPELFAMIGRLRKKLGAPRFHEVLITEEFNAGVVQSPRLGIFGWPRNYLLIGLPLMQALSEPQFEAVLAHEFGHLARNHGKLSNWIYRQRLRWSRLLTVLDATESKGSFLFKPFLNWFSPYFNAYSFPLARANELQADATAAQLVSAKTAAQALTAVNVVGSYLGERYWQQIHRQADEQPHPAFAPYANFAVGLANDLDATSVQTWLDQALARQTNLADTHPALSDRLSALGTAAELALPTLGEAADRLLGQRREALIACFDQHWQDGISSAWEARYQEVQNDRQKLGELNARLERGENLDPNEAFDRALLTESVGGNPENAQNQIEALQAAHPDNALFCLALGARRLNRNDPSGCALLEQAMQLDENATAKCCELLRDYHWRENRRAEADAWHQRLVKRQELVAAAERERSRILTSDKFERHGLDEASIEALREQLKKIPGLAKAYLVKKRVKHLAHIPCYILGFRARGFFGFQRKRYDPDILRQLQHQVRLPGETLIMSIDGGNYRFGRKFAWMRGTRIL